MQARYYNPYLCRFINPDPSGFQGGLNFYAYANGNPVSYLDPFGLNAQATGDGSWNWTGTSQNSVPNLNIPVPGLDNQNSFVDNNPPSLTQGDPNATPYSTGNNAQVDGLLLGSEIDPNSDYGQQFAQNVQAPIYAVSVGATALEAVPTMSIAVGDGVPFHVAYGVGDTWVNAVGSSLGNMTVSTYLASETAANAWVVVPGIPVLFPSAVVTTGQPALSCATAAFSAFLRGWGF
jgi:uncharacterized protein RhaS with RHS repeats